jgi:ATP-binding cassette subfamily C exporter for protease/lipase
VVIVTHRPSILKISTRLLVLSGGRQLAFGPTAEVLAALARKSAGLAAPGQPAATAATTATAGTP